MTIGMDTGWLHVGFGKKGSDFSYLKTWLVREAQIRNRGYVRGGRYKGYVTERSGRGPRQPPFAAHPYIYTYMTSLCTHVYIYIYIDVYTYHMLELF